MFFGEYHHQIDEKCRIRIPTKLKELLGDKPFLMKGSTDCLYLLPEQEKDKMFEKMFGDNDMLDEDENTPLRLITASGIELDEDKQGRYLIPNTLLEHADIKKNIVTIGAYNRVEIWSEELWKERNSKENFAKAMALISSKKKTDK